jgi:hypothetical protein
VDSPVRRQNRREVDGDGMAKKGRNTARALRLSKTRLDELVEEATVDCYNEDEELTGLLTMIQDHLAVPFETKILGVAVTVERVDFNEGNEIVAFCRRGQERQAIPVLNLALPSPSPNGIEWIEAYRHWARPR